MRDDSLFSRRENGELGKNERLHQGKMRDCALFFQRKNGALSRFFPAGKMGRCPGFFQNPAPIKSTIKEV